VEDTLQGINRLRKRAFDQAKIPKNISQELKPTLILLAAGDKSPAYQTIEFFRTL
jgi:hypothetical protein